jgi:hypothetical protein
MSNKYETGVVDSHGNREFDLVRVFNDMQKVVKGKIKMSKSLYEVMYLRFTIAHYDMRGWIDYYNGNWCELANELCRFNYYGDFEEDNEQAKAKRSLVEFLKQNHAKII